MRNKWDWPDWVPIEDRDLIENFWNRLDGKRAWIDSWSSYPPQPTSLGGRIVGISHNKNVIVGRWIPRWGGLGTIVTDDGVRYMNPRIIGSSGELDNLIANVELMANKLDTELSETRRFLGTLIELRESHTI